jgi:tetratricopeptide (TPR) repeat protein
MFLSPSQKIRQKAVSWIKRQLIVSGTYLATGSTCLALMLVVGTASGVRAAETDIGGTNNATAMNYFKEGTAKMDGGDNSGALVAFTQAITLDPKFYKAYANRCASRINLRDYKGAIEDINVALKCFPNEPKVLALKTQAENLLQNQGNESNNNQQAMAQERAAAARRALAQAMIGGDFADPSTMIMMQAQRNGLMNGNAGAARPMVNPFAPKVAPEGSSGKDNPFTVHNQPEISSASSTNDSPFARSSNSSAQSLNSGASTSSSSGSDNPFDEKKPTSETSAAPKANVSAENLPSTARFKGTSTAGNAGSARAAAKQYYELGCAKAEAKKFSSAIEEFGQAISHDGNFGEAYANRGLCKFHNHDYQGALTDFQRADQLISNNGQIKSFIQSTKRALGN